MAQRLWSFAFLLIVCFLVACAEPPEKVTLIIAAGGAGDELDLTVAATQRFMKANPDIRVGVRPIPRSSSDRLRLFQKLLSEQSDEVDVYQIDVVWTGMLVDYAVDLKSHFTEPELQKHFELIIDNNSLDGKLVGIPWFSDAPFLFYRTDLLNKYGFAEPPETWEEFEQMARVISAGERKEGNLGFWGYVWQGAAYEGLTCNALEWTLSNGGRNLVDSEGNVEVYGPAGVQALSRAAGWIGSLSPPQVLEFAEEESRQMWQRGDAAFLRNWSFVYSTAQKDSQIAGKFGVAPLPAGPGGRAAVLGGWQLMISRYSRYPEAAARLVKFLASESEQRTRAIEGSYCPTLKALYRDPEILSAVPFLADFEETIEGLVARPSTVARASYGEVSEAYFTAVHEILRGANPEVRLKEAEAQISEFLK